MMRILNLIVIAALVVAAAYVYRIKFESTVQAERAAKLRTELHRERDRIARLRAEWAKLDNPQRIQGLASRHLPLKPVQATQFGAVDSLPVRPPSLVPPGTDDPIGAAIEALMPPAAPINAADDPVADLLTGSIPDPARTPATETR